MGHNPQSNGNGLKVNIPDGYDVLWLRVTNDRWNIFRKAALELEDTVIDKYACFQISLNEISPDGRTSDSFAPLHKWCPMPLHKKRSLYNIYRR